MTETTTMAGAALAPRIREFIADTRFASVATLDPDGTPRQAVVWYRLDGDEIVLNSAVGRRWPANLVRDGRVSLSIGDA
jgi:predicted pyridoxine 5'-phosphate oxidase superfamily flavin-nucleotide-binding protein